MTKLNNMLKVNDHVVITKMSINYLSVLECKSRCFAQEKYDLATIL